jgi:site-specific DNA-methyltransferase (adenine-specific)
MTELTLYNGDCLQVMKELADKSVDLIICDLPYGCLMGGGGGEEKAKRRELVRYVDGKGTTNTAVYNGGVIAGCSWDVKIDLEAFWKEIKRIRKSDNTPTIHFCNTRFGIDLINSNTTEYRYDLVWAKTNAVGFLFANKRPMASHEMIYVFAKNNPTYERINIKGDFPKGGGGRGSASFLPIGNLPNTAKTIAGERCPTSVITIPNKKEKKGHPTQKPSELYEWLITRYCPVGGTVLDPTFGSGNSVFEAFRLGRNAIGIEKDETFFKKAEERLAL